MTCPYRHQKTGYYWIRKRVPLDLQALVGKREEKFSLKTRDANEAKKLALVVLAEIEQRWSSLRLGVQALFEREALGLAEEVFRFLIERHADNPEGLADWHI